jgi:hypothetical protein
MLYQQLLKLLQSIQRQKVRLHLIYFSLEKCLIYKLELKQVWRQFELNEFYESTLKIDYLSEYIQKLN